MSFTISLFFVVLRPSFFCHFWSMVTRLRDLWYWCLLRWYKCVCTNLVKWALLIFLPIAPSVYAWAWVLLAAVLCRKLLLDVSLSWFPIPRVTAFWGKKLPSLEVIQTAQFIPRDLICLLKGNLLLWTQFPCQFSLFSSPDLLRSLITTALGFVSLANLDFLPDHWYLYWCLDCSSSQSPGKEDMGFHFAGEIEELIYCWRGK